MQSSPPPGTSAPFALSLMTPMTVLGRCLVLRRSLAVALSREKLVCGMCWGSSHRYFWSLPG